MQPVTIAIAAGVVLLVFAALHDVAFRTVPNIVAAAIAICGLMLHDRVHDLFFAMAASGLVFLAAAACWRRGWMGGGDVKLLGAAAMLVAPMQVPMMLAGTALAGGLLTFPYLITRLRRAGGGAGPCGTRPASLTGRIVRVERRRLQRGGPLPYAVAIATGVVWVVFQGGVS